MYIVHVYTCNIWKNIILFQLVNEINHHHLWKISAKCLMYKNAVNHHYHHHHLHSHTYSMYISYVSHMPHICSKINYYYYYYYYNWSWSTRIFPKNCLHIMLFQCSRHNLTYCTCSKLDLAFIEKSLKIFFSYLFFEYIHFCVSLVRMSACSKKSLLYNFQLVGLIKCNSKIIQRLNKHCRSNNNQTKACWLIWSLLSVKMFVVYCMPTLLLHISSSSSSSAQTHIYTQQFYNNKTALRKRKKRRKRDPVNSNY